MEEVDETSTRRVGESKLELLSTDVDGHHLSGSTLFYPISRMRVTNQLTRFVVDVILRLALVRMFGPATPLHVSTDLLGRRMSALNILHAGDDARQRH